MKVRGAFLILVMSLVFYAHFGAAGESEYLALFIDGQKCGFAVHSRIVADEAVRTVDHVMIKTERLGVPLEVSTVETCLETLKGEPLGFEVIQNMSAFQTIIKGKVSPEGVVDVTGITGQIEQKKSFEWPGGAIMAEGLRLLGLRKGLAEGTEYSAQLFSPSMMQAMNCKITVGPKKRVDLLGRVVSLTEVKTSMNVPMSGEIESTSYVDDELTALKTIMPMMGMQLEMMACSKEFALSENEPADFIKKAFVSSPKPLEGLGSAKAARYRIRPQEDAKNLRILSDDNQQEKQNLDGTIIVTVRPVKMPGKAKFGYHGNDAEVLEALQPNQYVQSDNKEIRALAKEAVGKTKNAAEAARKIESFVAGYIENANLSVGYASAVEVAQSKQGDCTEFAVLTAALCRATGIPARIVVGIAYVDEFMGYENVFGGHAWTEAYVGGRWVGLDSAFAASGRGGYDAGHIALAAGSGELEGYFNLLFSIGQFKIEDVAIER